MYFRKSCSHGTTVPKIAHLTIDYFGPHLVVNKHIPPLKFRQSGSTSGYGVIAVLE
jgi:hypothetical protein